MIDADRLRQELANAGETAVKLKLAQGVYGVEKRAVVEHWLREQQAQRETAASELHDAREEESLRLAHEANVIARHANEKSGSSNRIAAIALIVAALALLAQIVQALIDYSEP